MTERSLRVGIIGLDPVGLAAANQFLAAGYEVIGYDEHSADRNVTSLQGVIDGLPAGERVVLVMLPVDATAVQTLTHMLQRGDTVIHCQSQYDAQYEEELAVHGIKYGWACVSRNT